MEFSYTPAVWKKVKLIDVAIVNMGQSPSSSDVNNEGDGLAFFQGKAEFGKLNPIPRKYCTAPKKIAESGDILLSVRAPVGPTNVANQKTAIGRGLSAVRAEENIVEKKFLLYFFRCIEPWLSQQGTGTTFKAISGAFLKGLDSVLPPLAEQRVIADKLDTLLAQVDNTKARLERIHEILKRFRQSVLAAAVSGRLTEEWRVSNQVTKPWATVAFSELTDQLRSGSGEKPSDDTEGVPILRSSAVRPMAIDFEDIKYLTNSNSLKVNNYLKEKDLLFTRLSGSAEYVGNCAMVRQIDHAYQYPDRLFCARLIDTQQAPFLEYFFASQSFREHIFRSLKSSAGHQRITLDVIKKAIVFLPSLEEQTEIVRRVEQLFAYADTVERQVKSALERVNQLTQSILAKAFRGELTAQWRADNVDLISGDNSAEALLEHIKAKNTKKKLRRKA